LKRYEKVSLGKRRTSGKAVASLVLGILSLVASFFCVGLITSFLAMVLGYSALLDIKRSHSLNGKGLAQAGLILGAITMAIAVVIFALAMLGYFTWGLFRVIFGQ
jgi:hypothetical protein